MLIPTGGFGWVLGSGQVAPPGANEVLLGMSVDSPEQVEHMVERMRIGGGQVLAEPAQQEWGFTGVATDPDGHAWQIQAGRLPV